MLYPLSYRSVQSDTRHGQNIKKKDTLQIERQCRKTDKKLKKHQQNKNAEKILTIFTNLYTIAASSWSIMTSSLRAGGRVVDCGGLENRWTERFRRFESYPARHFVRASGEMVYTLAWGASGRNAVEVRALSCAPNNVDEGNWCAVKRFLFPQRTTLSSLNNTVVSYHISAGGAEKYRM